MKQTRRKFLTTSTIAATGICVLPSCASINKKKELFFEISLAEWSLHNMLFEGKLKNIDFPKFTKDNFDIHAVEYVNSFFKDKAKDKSYLQDLKSRTKNEGIRNVLIMIDREGDLGDSDDAKRIQSIENHYKWVEAAQYLGCHSIRVNARGNGTEEEVAERVVKSLTQLSNFAKDYDINIIVENHGGYSSNGKWLSGVMKSVNLPNCGTLPDFGNFFIDRKRTIQYDRYKGMEELMPFAKGVSAKCYDFKENGDETSMDFNRILKIVKNAGYNQFIGIEYEGKRLSEVEGIKACKKLLIREGKKLS